MSKPIADTAAVRADEVAEILRDVAYGRRTLHLADAAIPWTADDRAMKCTNVPFVVDGWNIVLVNNMMTLNHVDSAVSPDGREAQFENWPQNPQSLLSWNEIAILDNLLEKNFPTT